MSSETENMIYQTCRVAYILLLCDQDLLRKMIFYVTMTTELFI